ncbi:MAG: putative toxin-antitoxin system toxin component, PIN family [Bacteroidetes bacterium]|nr:putative toxin-antitoxin system toxin component, PIN family [Bacteroidota bacterium]
MSTTALKVVLDVNILIAIIGKSSPFRWVFDCIADGRISLCVTTEILLEYREILERKNGLEVGENVLNLITVIPFTEKVDVFFNFHLITKDKDDNKYVDCAIAANAVCLVSNDKHFQEIKQVSFPSIQLLTLPEFEEKYKNTLSKNN